MSDFEDENIDDIKEENSAPEDNSQYRMSFRESESHMNDSNRTEPEQEQPRYDYYREPEPNNYNGGGNRGPIIGIIASLVFMLAIVGALIGLAKLTGADKDAQELLAQNASTEATENESKPAESESKSEGTNESKPAQAVTLSKGDKIETTEEVAATLLDVSKVVEEVMPAVVAVTNTTVYKSNGNYWSWYLGGGSKDDYSASGAGSGVIIAENEDELLIVTNAHVVVPEDLSSYGLTPEASEYSVTFCNDETITAYLKGYNEDADLAIIVVKLKDIDKETLDSIKIAKVGNSDELKVGNGVIAIGNALGFGQSVTVGYVSAINRDVTINKITRTLLQTDAAINPGNSGGGLFNVYGQLIGINSAKYASEKVESIGYAIPITSAEDIITDLMNQETLIREPVTDEDKKCYLGVMADKQYVDAYNGQGAFVGSLVENGPAEKAGIMAYDIITAINDVEVTSWTDLQNELAYHEGGEKIKVTYYTLEIKGNRREYVEHECEVTLGFMKDYKTTTEE